MSNQKPAPAPGVYCTLEELSQDAMKAVGTLHLRRKSRVLHSGAKRSSIRGRGMEFFESRPYVIPDEMRSIDWKVSARLNTLFTKIFVEEKDRPIVLALDFRSHMYFGTRNYFKSVLAAKIAARLAQAAINGGDPVRALFFDDHGIAESRLGARRKDLALILGMLAHFTQKPQQEMRFPQSSFWHATLSHLYNRVPRGSAVFIISDFQAFDSEAHNLLYRLRKRADIFALSLLDPLEEHLPRMGILGMNYGDQEIFFDSSQKHLQEAYSQRYKNNGQKRAQIFLSLDIPELSFCTADNLDQSLVKLFSGRW